MNTEQLFLSSNSHLEGLVADGGDYAMLRASAILRQMLMDGDPLLHQVNRGHRMKLRFPVCGRKYAEVVLQDGPVFYSALGGIHTSGTMAHSVEMVPLDAFLASKVLKLGAEVLTVRDLISISANVLGGVHKGAPRTDKDRALQDFNNRVSAFGQSLSAAQLKPIVLVALDGMKPLVDAVRGEAG